jgi:hypothetical protein
MKSQFEPICQEDCNQFRKLAKTYKNLKPEDNKTSYQLTLDSWLLAQRWSEISSNASIIATENNITKMDFQKWAYEKYRQLQLMHEHCRAVWRTATEELRANKVIGGE